MEDSKPTGYDLDPEPTADDLRAAADMLRHLRIPAEPEPGTQGWDELVRKYAGIRAYMGAERFDLVYGLRPPRHAAEAAVVEYYAGQIDDDGLRAKLAAYAQRPVDLPMLQGYCDYFRARVEAYSKMLQTVIRSATDQRDRDSWKQYEPQVDGFVAQMELESDLYRDEMLTVHQFLLELRASKHGEPVRCGDFTGPTASNLVLQVLLHAAEAWRRCKVTGERSRSDSAYLYATTASRLFHEVQLGKLAKPNDLLVLIELEQAAAAAALKDRKRSAQPAAVPSLAAESMAVDIRNWQEGAAYIADVLARKMTMAGNAGGDPPSYLSAPDLVKILDIPAEKQPSVEKRLARLRQKHALSGELYVECQNVGANQPRFLYNLQMVRPHLADLISTDASSVRRPSEESNEE